jgi:hypothetical protein
MERKLTDKQYLPIYIGKGKVHFIVAIAKYPHLYNLRSQPVGILGGVGMTYPEQYQKPLPDPTFYGAFNVYGSFRNTLNNSNHK